MKRTQQQNRRIWTLVSELQAANSLTRAAAEERMREINHRLNGTRSTSALNTVQATALIRAMMDGGRQTTDEGRVTKDEGRPPDPDALATEAQIRSIKVLWQDAGITTEEGKMKMCKRITGSYMPITRGDAIKLHQGLESMALRKIDKADIDKMLAICIRNREMLDDWQKKFIDDITTQAISQHRKLNIPKIKKLKEAHGKITKKLKTASRKGPKNAEERIKQ